jgi:hypothetical protein
MKRILLIVVGIIVIIGAVLIFNKAANAPKIVKAFTVEEGTFLAIAQDATKIEVYAVPEGKKMGKDNVKLGTMELVEKNDKGEQTWIMPTPEQKQSYIEIYAKPYGAKDSEGATVSLAQKGKDDIASVVWPAPKQVIIYGLVRELSGNTMRITNGSAREFDIVVTLPADIKLLDQKGKAITRSRLTKNTMLVLTGNFTDEQAFTASQIELR